MVDREKVKVLAMEAKEQENIMMRNIANKYSEEDNIKALARQVQCIVAVFICVATPDRIVSIPLPSFPCSCFYKNPYTKTLI